MSLRLTYLNRLHKLSTAPRHGLTEFLVAFAYVGPVVWILYIKSCQTHPTSFGFLLRSLVWRRLLSVYIFRRIGVSGRVSFVTKKYRSIVFFYRLFFFLGL